MSSFWHKEQLLRLCTDRGEHCSLAAGMACAALVPIQLFDSNFCGLPIVMTSLFCFIASFVSVSISHLDESFASTDHGLLTQHAALPWWRCTHPLVTVSMFFQRMLPKPERSHSKRQVRWSAICSFRCHPIVCGFCAAALCNK